MTEHARILGTGSYVGETVVTNHELSRRFETSDEWIQTHLGITERRLARPDQTTSDLAAEAGRRALEMAGIKPEDVDLIVLATCSPDHLFPGTGIRVREKLGATKAAVFDMKAQCAGFVYLATVGAQMALGDFRNVLVIAAELIIRMMAPTDRISHCLFGDGASAMVLSRDSSGKGIQSYHLGADGGFYSNALSEVGGSAEPFSPDNYGRHFIQYRLSSSTAKSVTDVKDFTEAKSAEWTFIRTKLREAMVISLAKIGKTPADMDFFLPHPGNMANYHALLADLQYPREKTHVVLERYGNSSGPQSGIALDEAARSGKIKSGDLVGISAVGMGMHYGAFTFRW